MHDVSRFPSLRASLGLALPLLLATTGEAQYLNRAVYLGRDAESMRRRFDHNAEYMLSRFSYLPAPWWQEDLDPFRNTFEYYVGSTTSVEFTFEGRVQMRHELGEGFAAHFHLLQSENRDEQFVRTAVEVEYAAGDSWSAFAMFEGGTDKSQNDVSLGAYLSDAREGSEADYCLRFMVTAVDAFASKSEDTKYSSKPYGLMLSGIVGRRDEAQLVLELGSQLPATLDELDLGQSFEIERHIVRVGTRIPLGDRDWLLVEMEAEYTEKERIPNSAADPQLERLRRNYFSSRAEWWRRLAGGNEFSVGLLYFKMNEDGYRPNLPSETLSIEREEFYGFARARFALDENWALEPSIYAGYAEFEEALGPTIDGEFNGFQGKAGAGLTYQFSPDARVMLNMTFEIDRPTFSGANLQFQSHF